MIEVEITVDGDTQNKVLILQSEPGQQKTHYECSRHQYDIRGRHFCHLIDVGIIEHEPHLTPVELAALVFKNFIEHQEARY